MESGSQAPESTVVYPLLDWLRKTFFNGLLARAGREKVRPFCTAQIDKYLPGKLPG